MIIVMEPDATKRQSPQSTPPAAWCDADQALTPAEFATLMTQVRAIAGAIGRDL